MKEREKERGDWRSNGHGTYTTLLEQKDFFARVHNDSNGHGTYTTLLEQKDFFARVQYVCSNGHGFLLCRPYTTLLDQMDFFERVHNDSNGKNTCRN